MNIVMQQEGRADPPPAGTHPCHVSGMKFWAPGGPESLLSFAVNLVELQGFSELAFLICTMGMGKNPRC